MDGVFSIGGAIAAGLYYRLKPLILVQIFLVMIPSMINIYCAASFGSSLIVPPLLVNIARTFANFLLSIALYVWVNFWAAFRHVVGIFDMILSVGDYNIGRHLDESPKMMRFMKGTGIIKMFYPTYDYEQHEESVRKSQEREDD